MFKKFERLEEDRNTSIEGTGLGLAITEGLAELMGGKITVISDYGKGSTFKFVVIQEIVNVEVKEEKATLQVLTIILLKEKCTYSRRLKTKLKSS